MSSRVDDQVRLVLEQQCAELFRVLMHELPKDAAGTLFFLDYSDKEGEPFKNVAYITALERPELIDAIEYLTGRWRRGDTSEVVHDRAKHGWVPDGPTLKGLGDLVKERVPAGVGFALMFGKRDGCQYLATCDRAGMIECFEKELLPAWRAEGRRG